MSDIVTGTVTGQVDTSGLTRDHGDIRREQESIGANIRREVASEACHLTDSVKTTGWSVADRVGTEADRIVAQDTAYFIAGQQYAFSNAAAVAALKAGTDMQFQATQNAIQLAAEKNAAAAKAVAAATQLLVVNEAQKGRDLDRDLELARLRAACERNERCSTDWESRFYQNQAANLSAQLQAFQSQFQSVTQGTVNFGNMSGNAGRNTSTNNIV